jgi:hypothetical protein
MAIIEILTHKRSNSPYFIVDNSRPSVEMLLPIVNDQYMVNANGVGDFNLCDNFTLLSLGVKMPLAFEFCGADAIVMPPTPTRSEILPLRLIGRWGPNFTNTMTLNSGNILLPYENYEMSVNNYFDIPATWKTAFRINLWPTIFADYSNVDNEYPPNISMLNVPNSLNGKIFYITIFAKIEHTYDINAPVVP